VFEPVQSVRAYERVVEQIEEAVLSGRIRPHDRLPSERELMRTFAVGRGTVREALRVLQSKGLVRSRPGDPNGPEVLPLSTDRLRDSMAALARVEHLSLRELLQFRIVVESQAYRLAAALGSEGQMDDLEQAMAAMERAVDEGEEAFARADLAFHAKVAEAAGNKLFGVSSSVLGSVVGDLMRAKISGARDHRRQMRESCCRHQRVLAAVREREGDRAAALARRSIYDYYAHHLPEEDRRAVAVLLDGAGEEGEQ
jgi:GntR family transcriptional repressor for pyruvate dehydrogenase complex